VRVVVPLRDIYLLYLMMTKCNIELRLSICPSTTHGVLGGTTSLVVG